MGSKTETQRQPSAPRPSRAAWVYPYSDTLDTANTSSLGRGERRGMRVRSGGSTNMSCFGAATQLSRRPAAILHAASATRCISWGCKVLGRSLHCRELGGRSGAEGQCVGAQLRGAGGHRTYVLQRTDFGVWILAGARSICAPLTLRAYWAWLLLTAASMAVVASWQGCERYRRGAQGPQPRRSSIKNKQSRSFAVATIMLGLYLGVA